MTHDPMTEQAAAYALNAMSEQERTEFEAHLETCPECQHVLADLQEGAALLGRAEAGDVPELFRRRVLNAIADEPQEPATSVEAAAAVRPPWRTRITGIAAVLVAVMATVAVVAALTGGTTAGDVRTAADAVVVAVAPTPDLTAEVDGTFTYSETESASVLTLAGLPAVGDDATYQLWFVGEVIEASATFTPGDGNAVEVVIDRTPGDAGLIGITVEPSGGSLQPTTPILITAELDA
ncbi:MAG: anti-sigma factor [Acidimicrobiia bacterium]|nr:anti-sigma factor [Acidimicrobiia bacterium]NNF10852.1 anti-sigma factor [Acidimicrobiia bacterium]NNL71222.1 anti-sigma factor [Acidimicrobiia bacterium]